jgi:hypothetical protein
LSFSRVDSCVERKGREARGSDRAGADGRSEKRKRREEKRREEEEEEEEVETYGCGREELRQRLAGFDALSLDVSSSISERLPARIRKGDEPLEE